MQSGSELVVWAKPRASRSEVLGVRTTLGGAALEVWLAALPAKGAANLELLMLLARTLRIPRGQHHLVQGATGRCKRVRILGLSPEDVLSRLF